MPLCLGGGLGTDSQGFTRMPRKGKGKETWEGHLHHLASILLLFVMYAFCDFDFI